LLEPDELIGEMEMLHQMEHFFDRALYFAAIGYEGATESEPVRARVAETSAGH